MTLIWRKQQLFVNITTFTWSFMKTWKRTSWRNCSAWTPLSEPVSLGNKCWMWVDDGARNRSHWVTNAESELMMHGELIEIVTENYKSWIAAVNWNNSVYELEWKQSWVGCSRVSESADGIVTIHDTIYRVDRRVQSMAQGSEGRLRSRPRNGWIVWRFP